MAALLSPRVPWRVMFVAIAAWAVFVGFAYGPVVGLAVQSVQRLAANDSEAWALLLPSARRAVLLGKSVSISLAVAVISGVVGALGALAFLRWAGGRKTLEGLKGALLAGLVVWVMIPPYLHGLAGMQMFSWAGKALGAGAQGVPGWVSLVMVQSISFIPIPLIAAVIGLLNAERALVEAGLMLTPAAQVFRRIVLPLTAPAVLAGLQLVFVFSLLDSSTPSLFGVSSYAMEIVAEYSASHTPWRAAILAFPLIVVTATGIGIGLFSLARVPPSQGGADGRDLGRYRALHVLIWPTRIALLIAVGYAVVTLVMMVVSTATLRLLPGLMWELRRDLGLTLTNGLLAATLSAAPATIIAWSLLALPQNRGVRAILWGGVLLPLALPASLTGVGIASLLTCCAPESLRLSPLLPVIGHVARFLPLAVLVIFAHLRRQDRLILEAADLLRPPGLARWRMIEGPLALPGLLAAFGLVFSASIGELEATLMIAPPGGGVLSMRIFNYLHYGASETVAALGLIMVITVWLGVSGALVAVLRRR